jgi:SAM-dependent methyltransferase
VEAPEGSLVTYTKHAAELREAFANHAVSQFETTVNEPRFAALLPKTASIRRILDIGCGPAFPDYLRSIYPDAEILGIDIAPELLPEPRPDDPKTHFAVWQGPGLRHDEARRFVQEHGGPFDLVVAKMMAHYVWLDVLDRDVATFRARGGYVAMSVPHPEDSGRFVPRPDIPQHYTREIGNTGIEAQMIHRPLNSWDWSSLTTRLPDSYRAVIDEPATENGDKKRLNVLLRPATRTEKLGDALLALVNKRLRRTHRVDLGAARQDTIVS